MANYQTAVKEATSAYFSDIISNNNPNPKRKEEKRETEKKGKIISSVLRNVHRNDCTEKFDADCIGRKEHPV